MSRRASAVARHRRPGRPGRGRPDRGGRALARDPPRGLGALLAGRRFLGGVRGRRVLPAARAASRGGRALRRAGRRPARRRGQRLAEAQRRPLPLRLGRPRPGARDRSLPLRADRARAARLRDGWLWPGAHECAARNKPPHCSRINRRRSARSTRRWPRRGSPASARSRGPRRSTAWQVAAALADLALLAVLLALLRRWGRDPRWIVLYAWSPLVVLEVAQNGHVDGLAALLAVGAIAALTARPALAGALLAGATLVKLYPAVLLPAARARRAPRALAVFAGVCALAYVPHVLAVGTKVIGYLGGYLQEEHYDSGGRFQLLGLLGLPAGVTRRSRSRSSPPSPCSSSAAGPRPRSGRRGSSARCSSSPPRCSPGTPSRWPRVAALSGAWWWSALCLAGQVLYWQTLSGGWDGLGPVAYALSLALVLAVLLRRTIQTRPETRNAPAVSAAQKSGGGRGVAARDPLELGRVLRRGSPAGRPAAAVPRTRSGTRMWLTSGTRRAGRRPRRAAARGRPPSRRAGTRCRAARPRRAARSHAAALEHLRERERARGQEDQVADQVQREAP